jgi:hypothetical protein
VVDRFSPKEETRVRFLVPPPTGILQVFVKSFPNPDGFKIEFLTTNGNVRADIFDGIFGGFEKTQSRRSFWLRPPEILSPNSARTKSNISHFYQKSVSSGNGFLIRRITRICSKIL